MKKHLRIIHKWSNHSWHELLIGVSLYFCKSWPFFHIFNQKSLNLCYYLGVTTFYQERLIDFVNVEKNLEPREIYKDVKFDDKKWFAGESEKMILNYAETESKSEWMMWIGDKNESSVINKHRNNSHKNAWSFLKCLQRERRYNNFR